MRNAGIDQARVSFRVLLLVLQATREDVVAAAKQAYCHEFISSFPQGYDDNNDDDDDEEEPKGRIN
jgi:hypothetical protein